MGINIEREKILLQGFTDLAGIRKFIPCGYHRAKRIRDEIAKEAEKEGKNTEMGFDPKRLLKYVHLTRKEVFTNAEVERKNESAGTDSRV